MNNDKTKDLLPTGQLVHRQVTEQIIGAAMEVHNTLGSGFLEKVYENSLAAELRIRGLTVKQQKPVVVHYKGDIVGEYVLDMLVNDLVVVELKTAECLSSAHEAQMLNYLRATELLVGLLINFHGPRIQWKRLVV